MWPRQHPWQYKSKLPNTVTEDYTCDATVQLSAPPEWILLQRNKRLLIRNPVGVACHLEAVQAGMLELINQGNVSYNCFKTELEPYHGADTSWLPWPESREEEDALGSQRVWPAYECVLLLDTYLQKYREAVLRRPSVARSSCLGFSALRAG